MFVDLVICNQRNQYGPLILEEFGDVRVEPGNDKNSTIPLTATTVSSGY